MKLPFGRAVAIAALALAAGIAPLLSLGGSADAAPPGVPLVRLAAGAAPADIQAALGQFRADLGGVDHVAGPPAADGRREINWDGVPDQFDSPNAFPPDFFRSRGSVYSTPGTGFQNSAKAGNPTNTPVRFGNIDPSYTTTFAAFSPERIFTPIGSNIMDVNFFIPGTNTPATVKGFGAVFTDVDLVGTTIEYFNAQGRSLGVWIVPPANAGFSFLGVSFINPLGGEADGVARVRITTGNTPLRQGAVDQPASLRDVVALDDFIYGEPKAIR